MQSLNGPSCYLLVKGLLPGMIQAGGGALVGISSIMSKWGTMAGEGQGQEMVMAGWFFGWVGVCMACGWVGGKLREGRSKQKVCCHVPD